MTAHKKHTITAERAGTIINFPRKPTSEEIAYTNITRGILGLPPCDQTITCLSLPRRNSINKNCPLAGECAAIKELLL